MRYDFPILPGILGFASGVGIGFGVNKFYNNEIPIPGIPSGWNTFGTAGMFVLSAISLIGSLFTKSNLKSGLVGLAFGSLISGLYNGFSVEQARARAPLRARRSTIKRSAKREIPKDVFVQRGDISPRESGLLRPSSSFQKYTNKKIIA